MARISIVCIVDTDTTRADGTVAPLPSVSPIRLTDPPRVDVLMRRRCVNVTSNKVMTNDACSATRF